MRINPSTWFAWRGWVPVPLLAAQLLLASPQTAHWGLFLGLVGAGEILRLWAAGFIGRRYRTRDSTVGALVTSGPYAYVRNPLYLGNTLQWLGLGAFSGLLWALVWGVCAGLLYRVIVPWEEGQLRAAWPKEFEQWSQQVHGWWPKRRGGECSHERFRFSQSLRSERSTLLVWLAVIVLFLIWGSD